MALNLLIKNRVKLSRIVLVPCVIWVSAVAFAQTPEADEPISGMERLQWFARNTIGPASLLGGTISAGFGTLTNQPHEYGTHWDGFGARYGMRLTGIVTGNAMEAGLGAIWGEDPR